LSAGLGVMAGLTLLACKSSDAGKTAPAASTSAAVVASAPPPVQSAAPSDKPKIGNQWGKSVGFKAPESALHDEKNDIYLVSNVDGKPYEADGKGFISKLAPMGQGVQLKWIEGGKNGVVLNAPKGMALAGDTLWVADLDTVRMFDRNTGAKTGDVKIPGATFLNDLAVTSDGRILVTDTGLKAVKDGVAPSGSDAVYAIGKDRKVTTIAKGKDLGGPNGIIGVGSEQMYVVTTGSSELYSLDPKGKRENVQHLPNGHGHLDGIVLAGNEYFISSWDANGIYRGKPGQGFELAIENVKSPADITFDKKRNRIIVPLMEEDEVRAYDLP
jgi:sugar lactone lactonase YvrE